MQAVVVGTGTTGSAVNKLLKQDAHQVVTVGRKSGDCHRQSRSHRGISNDGLPVIRQRHGNWC